MVTGSGQRILAAFARKGPARLAALATIGLLSIVSGCAAPGSDVHLAPFYTRVATGDGGVEVEALGGLYRQRRDAETNDFESVTLGPIWSADRDGPGRWRMRYLVPLGRASHRHGTTESVLLPVFVYSKGPKANGSKEWEFGSLPGILIRSNSVSGTEVGWFPFIGRFEPFITFDRLVFVAWPLFVYAERGEAVSYHFLYPFFGWTRGGGETSDHVFPLYLRSKIEGRYERYAFLWPFFHYQRNFLGPRETPQTTWMVFPFYGKTTRGTYRADTFLWPFFGYARDSESGFWAIDAPWFFVRLQRGPDGLERTRFWPFYSHLKAGTLEATNYLWPIVHIRHEDGPNAERDSVWVIPFWQQWDRLEHATGKKSSWRKLFPLFQYETDAQWRRGSFPTLDPFQRNELIDRHFSWLWKLWEWEAEGPMRRERSFAGMWRRERDWQEDRRSFAGLWSRRTYGSVEAEVRETSLLFGLLRWRVTPGKGFRMLDPAFPGPGWPARRGAAATPDKSSPLSADTGS